MSPSFDRVADFGHLLRAARRAARGKRQSRDVAAFMMDPEPRCFDIERALREGTWRPLGYTTFRIREPKPRLISAAPFADRVVHHALCAELEPAFERFAIADSYACRPGKGTRAALRRVRHFARRFPFALRLDVRSFFPSMPHDIVLQQVEQLVDDRRLIELVAHIVRAGAPGCPPGRGLPVGNLTSQHLGNLHLGRLDREIKQRLRCGGYVRYMDDMVLFAEHKSTLWRWHDDIACTLDRRCGQRLKPSATRVAPVRVGIPFLGYRVWPETIRLGPRGARRWRAQMRRILRRLDDGHINEHDAARAAAGLIGWARQADTYGFRASFFARRAAR